MREISKEEIKKGDKIRVEYRDDNPGAIVNAIELVAREDRYTFWGTTPEDYKITLLERKNLLPTKDGFYTVSKSNESIPGYRLFLLRDGDWSERSPEGEVAQAYGYESVRKFLEDRVNRGGWKLTRLVLEEEE